LNSIVLFGAPRSGTSWLGQILNSSKKTAYRFQPIHSYSFDQTIHSGSSSDELKKFHHDLLKSDDPYLCQNINITGKALPSFIKETITHIVWKEVRYMEIINNLLENSDSKIIGIIRHPCGVLSSWVRAPKEFEKNWKIEEEWRYAEKKNSNISEYYGYEKWLEVVDIFQKAKEKYPSRFKIVVYENLVRNPLIESRSLFEFCELEFEEQAYNFIKNSTSKNSEDPYDVFKVKSVLDNWKDILPLDIQEKIKEDHRFKCLKYWNQTI